MISVQGRAAKWIAVPAALAIAGAQALAAVGNPVAAVWKEHRVSFVYMGRTSVYSCEGLLDKVRALLLDLGARRDLKILPLGCQDSGRMPLRSRNPSLRVVFSTPSLPDPATKPLRDGDLAATHARFVSFTITSDAFRSLGVGDCELVDEFARQILPKLVTRDVKEDITCLPNQASGSRFWVSGEILKALPKIP